MSLKMRLLTYRGEGPPRGWPPPSAWRAGAPPRDPAVPLPGGGGGGCCRSRRSPGPARAGGRGGARGPDGDQGGGDAGGDGPAGAPGAAAARRLLVWVDILASEPGPGPSPLGAARGPATDI